MPATQAAADSCLSAPKGATPSGSHWYYRIDRVTKRQCWYLREESDTADDKFARAAPPASAPAPSSAAAEPAPPQQRTITRNAIADARAEWTSQQARAEPNSPAKVERRTVAAAPAPAVQNAPRAAMPNVLAPAPLASMRWNDAPVIRASANPTDLQLAAANPPAVQPPQAEEVQLTAADQAVPIAAEAAPAKPTASLQKLLLVMAAALALAGLTVSAIVRIGRMRARRAMRRKRRAMWDSAKTRRRAPQPMFHDEDAGAAAHRRRAQSARAPGSDPRAARPDPRAARADARTSRARARPPGADTRSARAATPAPGTATRAPGSRAPGSGAGAAGYGNAGPARPQRAHLTETEAAAIFPTGAAACERTRSGRCGARA